MGSKEQLTEAMAELLWERGYAATSPRDVLSAARVGQGSMYHHFSGKHELAVATFTTVATEATAGSALLSGEGSAIERIESYLTTPRPGTKGCRIGRMTQDPEVVTDAELIAIVAGAFDTMLGRWRTVISEAIADGELSAHLDPGDLANTLVAVIQGGYVLARAQGTQEPMDAAVRGAVALLRASQPTRHGSPQAGSPQAGSPQPDSATGIADR